MDAVANLKVQVPGRALQVQALIGVELSGNSGKYTFPAGIVHVLDSFKMLQRNGLNIFLIYLECRREAKAVKRVFTRVFTGKGGACVVARAGLFQNEKPLSMAGT
jgi:hypothetical protein